MKRFPIPCIGSLMKDTATLIHIDGFESFPAFFLCVRCFTVNVLQNRKSARKVCCRIFETMLEFKCVKKKQNIEKKEEKKN